jgi:hypothetical protein
MGAAINARYWKMTLVAARDGLGPPFKHEEFFSVSLAKTIDMPPRKDLLPTQEGQGPPLQHHATPRANAAKTWRWRDGPPLRDAPPPSNAPPLRDARPLEDACAIRFHVQLESARGQAKYHDATPLKDGATLLGPALCAMRCNGARPPELRTMAETPEAAMLFGVFSLDCSRMFLTAPAGCLSLIPPSAPPAACPPITPAFLFPVGLDSLSLPRLQFVESSTVVETRF